jgi:ATP-binding cassette subfamily B protein
MADSRIFGRLAGFARPHTGAFALAALLLAAATAAQQAGPLIVARLIDGPLKAGDVRGVWRFAALYLLLVVVGLVFQAFQSVLSAGAAAAIIYRLRVRLFTHVHGQPVSFFDANPVGRLMTRVIYDLESVGDLYADGVVAVFGNAATVVFVGGVMLGLDWRLGLAGLGLLPFLAAFTLFTRREIRKNQREARARNATLTSFWAERLAGLSTVQAYTAEDREAEVHERLSASLRDLFLRQIGLNALFQPVAEFFGAVSVAGLLFWGGFWGGRPGGPSLGVVVAAVFYVQRLYVPLRELADKWGNFQTAFACAERLFALLDLAPRLQAPRTPLRLRAYQGSADLDGVWFSYHGPEGPWALKDLTVKLKAGERVAVVGPTGSGKSTLGGLLLRLYDPQRGRVLADGLPLQEIDPQELRRQCALVLQEPYLFRGSVLENVRLADISISEFQVREACERTGADAFIRRLPGGYAAVLKEGGKDLSQGQRQLLALARALAHQPRLLILDEATACVDEEAEAQIQAALEVVLEGRSSLTIAHRLGTIARSDRILVMEGGRLVEMGDHAGLLAGGGKYSRLMEAQVRGEEAAKVSTF